MTLPAPTGTAAELGWPAMLDAACAGEGLRSAYQPIVDVARGTTVGYEALARFDTWDVRDPTAWFVAARAHGRHAELEAAALRSALRFHRLLPPDCFLTVNVSPDLLDDPRVRAVWRDHGDLTRLVVELTEQTPIASYAALNADVAALRAAGALLAVDDAGAGYAGLRHLLVLRPEIIKLDRELVRDLDVDEAKVALVEMVGTFADRIDAWVLAEGIEREAELDVLASLGVPLAQGYLLGRPGPPWPPVDPAVAYRRLAQGTTARGSAADVDSVRELVEPVPTTVGVEQVGAWFDDAHVHTVVVVDEHDRPRSVHTSETAGPGTVDTGLRVNVDTPVRQALARAMTRDALRRYQPLLCTDTAGRFLGVIRAERMIRTVLAAP